MPPYITTPDGQNVDTTNALDYLAEVIVNPDEPLLGAVLQQLGLSNEKVHQLSIVKATVHQHMVNQQVAQQVANLRQQSLIDTSGQETFATISKIKAGLNHSIESSRQIQGWTLAMYLAMFLLGFALVIAGAFFAKGSEKADWFTITFGASGFALLLATFFANPPRELQRVRANYVQLSILALGWLSELVDGSGVRSLLIGNQSDSDKSELYRQISTHQTNITQRYLQMMERYAEPRGKGEPEALLQMPTDGPAPEAAKAPSQGKA